MAAGGSGDNNGEVRDVTESTLFGRQEEITGLDRLIRQLQEGIGSCLVIEGPAGIGKSRLLAEGAALGSARGVRVVTGRINEVDRAAPLTALLAALRDHIDLGELDPLPENRFLLVNRLGQLIETAAAQQPILIMLDDTQWADELTVLTLRVLVPALRGSPVGWLIAMRSMPRRSPVRDALDWIATEHGQRMPLRPLSRTAIAAVCRNILGARPRPEMLTLAERSGGNPFLLEELLRSLRSSGRVQIRSGAASVIGTELPADFVVAVRRCIRELSPNASQLVEAGAVLGRPFSVHEVAALLGKPVSDMVTAASEALATQVLCEVGAELMFRHDLLREATYDGLPASVRRALHREAVGAVRAEGRPATEAARHLIHTAHIGDEPAIALIHEAADSLTASAPGAAADLLLRLLDLMVDDDPRRSTTTAEAVRMLVSAGRLTEARTLGEHALAGNLDLVSESAILAGLAEMFKHTGQDRVVVQYAQRALARPDVPAGMRAQLLAVKAHGLLYCDDVPGAERAAAEAMTVGRQVGETAAVVFGAVARSVAVRTRGHLAEATDLARQAVILGDEAGGDARLRSPRLWLGRALIAVDQFEEADQTLDAAQQEARQLGTAWTLPLCHSTRAHLRLVCGRLGDAVTEAEAGLLIADQLAAMALGSSLLSTLAVAAVRSGRIADAQTYLRRAQRQATPTLPAGARGDRGRARPSSNQRPHLAIALLHEARGRTAEAAQSLEPLYCNLEEQPGMLSGDPWLAPFLVRIARCVGDGGKATAAARAIRRLADLNPQVGSLTAAADHADGLLHRDTDALDRALALFGKGPHRLAYASALEDRAQVEHLAGRKSEAVSLLDEAWTLYGDMAARQDATRVSRRLRGLGVRRRTAPGSKRAQTGWASLSPSELKVVRLVAEGRSNRWVAAELFLSPHTVDSHLRHAFAKLGIGSRVELARRAMTEEAAIDTGDDPTGSGNHADT